MSNICFLQLLKSRKLPLLCYYLSFLTVNEQSNGFGLLIGKMKQCEDVNLFSGKFETSIFSHYLDIL